MLKLDNLNINEFWTRIASSLEKEIGHATFKCWIKPLEVFQEGENLLLVAPTKFMSDWVEGHYLPKIKLLSGVYFKNVVLRHKSEKTSTAQTVVAIEQFTQTAASKIDGRYTFENFIISESNELACAAAQGIADGSLNFNPVLIHSKVGLGKTHLLNAIANASTKKCIYLSAEKFMHNFIRALRERTIVEFKDELRSADVLMIDDFQFLVGKQSTQEEFFHTFDALIDSGAQVVIACDRAPAEFENLSERMRSRLSSGLVVDLKSADYDLRNRILKSKLSAQPNVQVPDNVVEFLAQNISSNIRELEGALNRITARASLVKQEIGLDNAKNWISDLLRIKPKEVTIEEIQQQVADFYKISVDDLLSSGRSQKIAKPRQLAMYLSKRFTTKSLQEIGRRFGGKDHATVIHACKRVEEMLPSNDVDALMAKFA